MNDINPAELSARVQGLLHARYKGDLAAAARELEVDEHDLRALVEGTPEPHLGVLSALIRAYGVDACWLLTGDYDYDLHRRALELEESGGDSKQVLQLVLDRPEQRSRDRYAPVTRASEPSFGARSWNRLDPGHDPERRSTR